MLHLLYKCFNILDELTKPLDKLNDGQEYVDSLNDKIHRTKAAIQTLKDIMADNNDIILETSKIYDNDK